MSQDTVIAEALVDRVAPLKPSSLPANVRTLPELLRAGGYFATNGQGPDCTRWGKTDYNFTFDQRKMFDGPDWRKRRPGQPFFAQVQLKHPHLKLLMLHCKAHWQPHFH